MENYKVDKFGYVVIAIVTIVMAAFGSSENFLVAISMGIWAEFFLLIWNTLIRKLKGNERLFALIIVYLIFAIGIRIIGAFKL